MRRKLYSAPSWIYDNGYPVKYAERGCYQRDREPSPFGPGQSQACIVIPQSGSQGWAAADWGEGGFKMLVTDKRVTCEAVSFFGRGNLEVPKPGSGVDIAYMPSNQMTGKAFSRYNWSFAI